MYWFWDVYLEAYRQWHHFAPIRVFLSGEDLTQYEPLSPLTFAGSHAATVDGLGLRGESVLVWLRSDGYTVDAHMDAWRKAGSPTFYAYVPPLVEGLSLIVNDMPEGAYRIQWFDPQKGEWLEATEATAASGRLVIPVPPFRRDLAAKILAIG
jgi:hypothetical protein